MVRIELGVIDIVSGQGPTCTAVLNAGEPRGVNKYTSSSAVERTAFA